MQTDAATEVVEHAVDEVVVAETSILAARVVLAEEVEHHELALGHVVEQVAAGVVVPSLRHPHCVAADVGGEGIVESLDETGLVFVRERSILFVEIGAAFVVHVHGVVLGRAHHRLQVLIVFLGNLFPLVALVTDETGSGDALPRAGVVHLGGTCLGAEVVGHGTREGGQHGRHAEAAHACKHGLAEGAGAFIPPLGVGTSVAFHVNHAPPSLEGGTSHVLAHFGGGVAVFLRVEVIPHGVETDEHERHVDAVQRHPVNLLQPALRGPQGAGVGVGTVVEIVAQVCRTGVGLFAQGHGEVHSREISSQLVPGQIDVGVVVEIPVDTRRHGKDAVTLDAGFSVLRGDDKDVFAVGAEGIVHDGDDAVRRTCATDAVEHAGDYGGVRLRRSEDRTPCRAKQCEHGQKVEDSFHVCMMSIRFDLSRL